MLRSNWLRYVVVGAVAGIAVGWLVQWGARSFEAYRFQHSNERIQAAKYEYEGAKDYVEGCLHGVAPSFDKGVACLAEGIEANREAKRSEYDLRAQQDMAEWAYAMFLVTGGGTAIAIFGIVLVFFTFGEARQTNVISREMGQRELRAYVGIEKTEITGVEIGSAPKAKLSFVNSGSTPAYDLKITAYIQIRAYPTLETAFTIAPLDEEPSNSVLGAGGSVVPVVEYRELGSGTYNQ